MLAVNDEVELEGTLAPVQGEISFGGGGVEGVRGGEVRISRRAVAIEFH